MSERSERTEITSGPALPDQPVPDKVLEELLAAFAVESPDPSGDPPTYDFDDPSIDRMLGIDTDALTGPTPSTDAVDEIDRLLDQTLDPAGTAAAPEPPVAPRTVVDLTGIDESVDHGTDRSPMPTGSTKREARAAARADAKAVKAAKRDAERSAKASRKQAEKEAKQAAKAARAAAKRGETPPPVAVPVAPLAPPADVASAVAAIDPLTPKPVPAAARERVPVGAGAPGGARRTIVIADDDQPGDALYLDEDAEQRLREIHAPSTSVGAGPRSTIVIEATDQRLDALPTTQAAPNIDPRLRARRQAVHQAASRRRLLWAGIVAGVVLVVVAAVATLASPLFDVRTIDVQGNQYTDQTLIEQVRSELRGEPVLLVDTQKIERELEANPWVESARVSTDFPHDVLVDIRERKPVATYGGSDGTFRVIDRTGRVLTVLGGRPTDYILLTGSAPDSEPGQFAGAAFAAGAQLAMALPDEIRAITTSIGVDATTNELSLELDAPDADGVHVRLGTVTGIEDKLARLVMVVRDGLTADQQIDVATNEVGS